MSICFLERPRTQCRLKHAATWRFYPQLSAALTTTKRPDKMAIELEALVSYVHGLLAISRPLYNFFRTVLRMQQILKQN
jgi:hypothetical protein